MNEKRIGRNIAGARAVLGWSQDDLAQAVSEADVPMTSRTLGKIERGEREARASEIAAITDALGIPADWVFSGPDWLETANALGGYLASAA